MKFVLYGNAEFHSLVKAVDTLRSDSEFCKINSSQHNRLSAALNHFMEFVKDNSNISPEHIEALPAPKTGSEKPKKNDNILKILSEHYKYGFRIDSTIELMRFRNFAEEDGIDIQESDDTLKKRISDSGLMFEGRVYTIDKQDVCKNPKNVFGAILSHISRYQAHETNRNRTKGGKSDCIIPNHSGCAEHKFIAVVF